MKILVLANFGMGLYKFRKELLKELVNQGNEVIITFPKDDYVTKLEEIGCTFIESKLDRRGMNPLSDGRLLVTYMKMMKKRKIDVVLSYTVKPNIYGGIASRILNIPFIPNITGLGTALENKGALQSAILFLYKISFKKAKCVFFQNHENFKFFDENNIAITKEKIIPGSGVNLKEHIFKEYPNANNPINLLFIGRIMQAKGMDELLEAAPLVKEQFPNVFFHIVGFCEENYLPLLEKLDSSNVISYHGQKDDIRPIVKESHAIILPSHHEGMSNVLLESAASGRPILASNIPGCRETFDEGITGFGFEPKNTESLFEAIEKFLKLTNQQKEQMGKAGRQKIEKEFNRQIIVNAYLNEIKAAMEESKPQICTKQ